MDSTEWSAAQFEAHRPQLRAVAYRMLGSLSEADDAVQESWLRLSRSGADAGAGVGVGAIVNLRAWLTTVVSRVCLDMLRARSARREDPLDVHVPDPVVTQLSDDPAEHALLADSVGLALLVVLDTLSPTERLAFVLHDIFSVPFDQVGAVLDRSPAAAKQLASRARQRLRGATLATATDPSRQREIVNAFQAAAREGDIAGLLSVLAPDVVLRADAGVGVSPLGPSRLLRGAEEVAAQAMQFAALARFARPVLVNGTPGFLVAPHGQPFALIGLTIANDKISEIDILADQDRLARLDLVAGQQQRAGQDEQSRDGDGRARAGDVGQQAAERAKAGDGRLLADRPGRQRAGDAVPGGVFEPVGGEDRVVQAHADDDRQLDRHHGREADDTGTDEGEADQPDRAQRADCQEDPVLAIAGHHPAGQPGADESAHAGRGEGETVLPGRKSELPEQEHGQQRLGGHDQSGHEQVVEVERAQAGMGEDMPPAIEQLARPDPALIGRPGAFFPAADRGDPQRGEQVAERIGDHGGDRSEQADRGAAERRPDRDGTPVGRLEPRVRHE